MYVKLVQCLFVAFLGKCGSLSQLFNRVNLNNVKIILALLICFEVFLKISWRTINRDWDVVTVKFLMICRHLFRELVVKHPAE